MTAAWISPAPLRWRSWAGPASAVIIAGAGGVIFDALTPDITSVGIFYVGLVLPGFWFTNRKAALALALVATSLIIAGHWITIPDSTPAWESWLNRVLAICVVWMTAAFVWYIRRLQQKMLAVNEELILGALRQRELTEAAEGHCQPKLLGVARTATVWG